MEITFRQNACDLGGNPKWDTLCLPRPRTGLVQRPEVVGHRRIQRCRVAGVLESVSLWINLLDFSPYPCRSVLGKRQREWGKEDVDMNDVLDGLAKKARDHPRVPMQVSRVVLAILLRLTSTKTVGCIP